MAEPIANDWKAINARMQQIKTEHSASLQSCLKCHNVGWTFNYYASRSAHQICDCCHNPERLPRPR